MKTALDSKKNTVHIDNVTEYHSDFFCKCCGQELIIKREHKRNGIHISKHFAHKSGTVKNCDAWYDQKNQMSKWHEEKQKLFDTENQEVTVKDNGVLHFADVKVGNKIIEFQKSGLSHNKFVERTKFYSKENILVWVFDMQDDRIEQRPGRKVFSFTKHSDIDRFMVCQKAKIKGSTITDNDLLCMRDIKEGSDDKETVMYFYLIFQTGKEEYLLVNYYDDEGNFNGRKLNELQFRDFIKNRNLTFKEQEKIDADSICINHKFEPDFDTFRPTGEHVGKCYGVRGVCKCKTCGVSRFTEREVAHWTDEWRKIKEETCCSEGLEILVCKKCYETVEERIIPINKDKHKLEIVDVIAATCTQKRITTFRCECGYEEIVEGEINPDAHSYELIEEVESTCNEYGHRLYKCKDCGKVEKEEFSELKEHEYNLIKTCESTCTEYGYELYECKHCGDIKRKDYSELRKHEYELIKRVESTCVKLGYELYKCKYCGDIIEIPLSELAEHQYKEIINEPTCEEDGLRYEKCDVCGDEKGRLVIPKLGHAPRRNRKIQEFDCVHDEVWEFICERCGKNVNRITKRAVGRHDFKLESTIEATENENKIEFKCCKSCGLRVQIIYHGTRKDGLDTRNDVEEIVLCDDNFEKKIAV